MWDAALQDRGAHAFCVLVKPALSEVEGAFRRNELSPRLCLHAQSPIQAKVRERLEALASTPQACAPKKDRCAPYEYSHF